jgi:DNA primase catalytic subunit
LTYPTRADPKEELILRQRLCFPVNHSIPSILQRRKYYSDEFKTEETKRWLDRLPKPLRNPIFAVDVGAESRIVRKKYRASLGRLILFSIADVGELREKLADFSPEDVYYDRNLYEDKEKCIECKKRKEKDCPECTNITGQHVMFDVDPENIPCPNCGTLEERIKSRSMYRFCYICFKKAAMFTRKLYDALAKKGNQKLEVIYSGRGFHVYLEDASSYELRFDKREALAKWAGGEEHIPIDPWVTRGGTRFARLPYSLHGLVGKIVTPIEIDEAIRISPSRDERFTPATLKVERSQEKGFAKDRETKERK